MGATNNKTSTLAQPVRGNKSGLRKALRFLGEAIAARSYAASPDDPMLQAWLARMIRWQKELGITAVS